MIGNQRRGLPRWTVLTAICVMGAWGESRSAVAAEETAAERGYRLLTTKVYLPADILASEFERLWEVWPEPVRSEAEQATPAQRRKMAFSRYGLMEDPEHQDGLPLGYVDDGNGRPS